ncbi:hypothetical protein J1N35_041328 [Gossypium stocksii]|uniref:BED-type domain-containing protein n=1 Tax=Gossypium stocksii TaxID=47602 RepID=A0A9D3UFE9_9ROSI|nr:hypothetical protein J1N35_041328 [Gossypium stocksii]
MTITSSNTPIPVDDGFNEYESAIKRQKSTTSKVWDEMTKLEYEDKNDLKAQCNHCKSIFFAKSSSGTFYLRRHLKQCLKKVNKDITQYTIANQPSLGDGPRIKSYKFDADECRRAVSTFLVCGKHSFRTIEEPGFIYMMRIASPNFKNISRFTATKDVLMYYAKERDHVKKELAKAPVKAGLELTDDVVGKIRNGIKYIKKLGIRRKRFYDVAGKSFHLNVTKSCVKMYPRYKLNYVQYCFTTIYGIHALDFVETILSNLRLLLDEYAKKSKSTSSSLAKNSNISNKDPVDSSLHQHNVNSVDFGGDFDESDDYKRYLNESSTKSEVTVGHLFGRTRA